MARYVGGPYDGRVFSTRYDHLPIIALPWPDNRLELPKTVEKYELRNGVRHHTSSTPYPRPEQEPTP